MSRARIPEWASSALMLVVAAGVAAVWGPGTSPGCAIVCSAGPEVVTAPVEGVWTVRACSGRLIDWLQPRESAAAHAEMSRARCTQHGQPNSLL